MGKTEWQPLLNDLMLKNTFKGVMVTYINILYNQNSSVQLLKDINVIHQ